jgi:hypothetical protein
MLKENGGIALWNSDNRKVAMKKLIIAIGMFPMCATLAQTNWTFQWHGQERGVIFGQTNFSESVKVAIRDDIAQILSNVPVSNFEIYPVLPNNPDFGKVDGLINFTEKEHIWPDDFRLGDYREINGIPFFLLSEEMCVTYASAVAFTNKYAAPISKMPAVIQKFTNGFDVANMTLKQKEQYIWNPKFSDMKKENKAQYEADITEALPNGKNWITVFKPSVLSYSKEDLEQNGKELLVCRLCIRVNRTPPTPFTLILVFKDGAWRWCPNIF